MGRQSCTNAADAVDAIAVAAAVVVANDDANVNATPDVTKHQLRQRLPVLLKAAMFVRIYDVFLNSIAVY